MEDWSHHFTEKVHMLGSLGGDTGRVIREDSTTSPVRGRVMGDSAVHCVKSLLPDTPARFSLILQVDIPRVLQSLWHPYDPAGVGPE